MIQTRTSSCFLATIVLLNVMWGSGLAQSPDTPDSECTNSLLSLINCEPFLAGENVSTPAESCCAGLNDLVKAAPTCLCGVIAGNPNFSSIDLTRALQLPIQCGIPIDQGQCAALGAPSPSPPTRPSSTQGNQDPTPSTGWKIVHSSLICSTSMFGIIFLLTNPSFVRC